MTLNHSHLPLYSQSLLPAPDNPGSHLCSIVFLFVEISYKWSHAVCSHGGIPSHTLTRKPESQDSKHTLPHALHTGSATPLAPLSLTFSLCIFKMRLQIGPALGVKLGWNEIKCRSNILHIHNAPWKLETDQTPSSKRMGKVHCRVFTPWNILQPWAWLASNDCNNIDECHKQHTEWKEPGTHKSTYSMIPWP